MNAGWTERRMLDLIALAFNQSSQGEGKRYVVAEHVHNGAGFSYGRALDAVALDTWPSGGLTLHGIEVKVSMSDLRRELSDTRKAAGFTRYLDHFSIAAAPTCGKQTDILALLPPSWGLLVPNKAGDALRCVRRPLMLHEGERDVDRSFMAAFCRALMARSESAAMLKAAREEGAEAERKSAQFTIKSCQRDHDALQATVAKFEEASGLKLSNWTAGKMGDAVRFIMDGGLSNTAWRVKQLRELAEELMVNAQALEDFGATLAEAEFEEGQR